MAGKTYLSFKNVQVDFACGHIVTRFRVFDLLNTHFAFGDPLNIKYHF